MPVTDFITAEWAPSSSPDDDTPTWVDVTRHVETIHISHGRDDQLDVYASGTAKIMFNNGDTTGQHPKTFDLDTWYRRRRFRVQGLFDGFIRDIGHDLTRSPDKASARVECDDILGLLADAELTGDWHDVYDPLIDNDVYRLHTTPEGVEGVIAKTGVVPYLENMIAKLGTTFPLTLSSIKPAATLPIFVPFEQTGNMWAILQTYLEAEGAWVGAVPQVGAYRLDYGGRWWTFDYGSSDPSYVIRTFSDAPAVGELRYMKDSVEWSSPAQTYANSVVCQSVDGEPQLAEDIPAGWPRDSMQTRAAMPVIDDNWVKASADLLLAIRKQTNTYPRQIKSVQWAEGLTPLPTIHIGDLHEVKVTFPLGSQTSYLVFVESITHDIDHEKWTTTLGYTSADRWLSAYPTGFYPDAGLFTLGDPVRGLGSGAIFAP